MATLFRLELLSNDSKVEIEIGGIDRRELRLGGGQSIHFELDRAGDTAIIKLIKAADPLNTALKPCIEPEFKPVPPSDKEGITVISAAGIEYYQGRPRKK